MSDFEANIRQELHEDLGVIKTHFTLDFRNANGRSEAGPTGLLHNQSWRPLTEIPT